MKLHPAGQIIIWCVLVVVMQTLTLAPLLVAASGVMLAAYGVSRHKFVQLLRRTRWVMISLLLIYSYTTPGESLFEALGRLSPNREGVIDGVLQLTRLLSALAGLAILLDRLHRTKLIAGLYTLLAPLQWLGLSRERVAVRLALTLHYAEVAMLRRSDTWQSSLRSLFEPHEEPTRDIELPLHRFTLMDGLLMAMAIGVLWWVLR